MPISSPSAPSIIPAQDTSAGNVKRLAAQLSKVGGNDGQAWSYAGDAVANLQRQTDHLTRALQQPVPIPNPLQITAADGSLIAQIGSIVDPTTNTGYSGIWGNNLYVGGQGPSTAPFFSLSNGEVVVGQNGQVNVLDPYGNVGAWLGTQTEAPRNITGAVANFGEVELTVTGHPYRNGDWVNVPAPGPGGVTGAVGQWLVGQVAANVFNLLGSTFGGTYTSGGTVVRFFPGGAFSTIAVAAGQRITNVVDNGSGLCRVTITAHRYSTGFDVTTTNVQGVPGANGTFLITVIDANTFDLIGSKFSGAYVSGGISINWPTAKLLAQGDGSLIITDAIISLSGANGTILIDPSVPSITATNLAGDFATMQPGFFQAQLHSSNANTVLNAEGVNVSNSSPSVVADLGFDGLGNGQAAFFSASAAVSVAIDTGGSPSILTLNGGDMNVAGSHVYRRAGVAGLSVTRNMVASLTTVANGVIGTPGVGQANTTVVTGVSLTASGFSGGILTS